MASTRALQRTFWKDLAPASLGLFLGAVSITFASLGFLTDIGSLGSRTPAGRAYVTVVSGGISAAYAWCATRGLRWIQVAVVVQILLLSIAPRIFPDRTGPVDLAASGEVGGDPVDLVDLPAGRWIGYVADASGHGVPAGHLMPHGPQLDDQTLLLIRRRA